MLCQELRRHDPGTVGYDLVDPATVADGLGSFGTSENGKAFAFMCLRIPGHADDEVRVRERCLGLFKLPHVSEVKQIKDTISIHSHRSANRRWVRFVSSNRISQTCLRHLGHRPLFAVDKSLGDRAWDLLRCLSLLFGLMSALVSSARGLSCIFLIGSVRLA